MRRCVVALLVLFSAQALSAAEKSDHPLIKSYPGSTIDSKEVKEFDEKTVVSGPPAAAGQKAAMRKVEGKLTTISYTSPAGRSVLEVMRNYEDALKAGGFKILYQCAKDDCYGPLDQAALGFYVPERFASAKLTRAAGDVWVSVRAYGHGGVVVEILEQKPMQTGMVKVDAEALKKDLLSEGHAAIYGIYFDTGKAELKPESAAALKEIATLLQKNASLSLHVVGHTDNVGQLPANIDLSRRRAAAVVAALTAAHKIPAARLRPDGVGPLAPVASNDTEDGRAKNRRVELVKQ